jgi:outer membrane lipoprotein SlyB
MRSVRIHFPFEAPIPLHLFLLAYSMAKQSMARGMHLAKHKEFFLSHCTRRERMEGTGMNKIRQTISVALVMALAGISMLVQAQDQRTYRTNDRATQQLLQRIETGAGRFRNDLASALDQNGLNNTQREDNINQLVADFEQEASQLSRRFNQRPPIASDVQAVLDRAARIDNFMQRRRLGGEVERDWTMLRNDLDQLANSYNIAWNWNNAPRRDNNRGYGNNRGDYNNRGSYVGDARMTGTYTLNTSRSMNAREVVENAVRNLPTDQRQRVTESLLRRLESPDVIAIEKRGRTFNIASSRAPQGTFEADGVEHEEQLPNSQRTSRVRVSLAGDQLTINSTGNRSSDFTVTFDPVGNGNGLRVTRRLYNDRLTQPIIVESVYDRTSDIAQWDVYTGTPNNAGTYPNMGNYPSNYPNGRNVRGEYIVPDGTTIVARLNDDLLTSRARSGDKFTMSVMSPSEYEGATIEGSVGNVDRGGRVTGRSEMALNLERITLRNGQSYRFEGTLESARTANGETMRVGTEGSVRESSQTNRTVKRTAIGTAIGAIIGGIAGGGSGAAIGAAVGAGAGAGSVYVQGRNDLELMSGSELTIRSSAPRTSQDR